MYPKEVFKFEVICLSIYIAAVVNGMPTNKQQKQDQHQQQKQQPNEINKHTATSYYWNNRGCFFNGKFRFLSKTTGYVICSEKTCPKDKINPDYSDSQCHVCCYRKESKIIFHIHPV